MASTWGNLKRRNVVKVGVRGYRVPDVLLVRQHPDGRTVSIPSISENGKCARGTESEFHWQRE